MVSDLEFLGWEVAEGGVQSLGVVPADPLGDCPFDLVSVAPGAVELDRLGFESAVEGLGHGVVVAIGDSADRSGAGLQQATSRTGCPGRPQPGGPSLAGQTNTGNDIAYFYARASTPELEHVYAALVRVVAVEQKVFSSAIGERWPSWECLCRVL